MSAALEPASLSLRRMTERDLTAVLNIERGCYNYPWSEGVFRDCLQVGYSCWVVEEVDPTYRIPKLEGYGIMSLGAGEAHILNLCVRTSSQQRGIGGVLLAHLQGLARERSATAMYLEVRPSNTPALQLYQRAGFTAVGRRTDYYPAPDGREDALILSRVLAEPTA